MTDPEVPREILDRFVSGTSGIAASASLLVQQARQLRDATPPLRAKAEQLHRDATLLFREMEHLLIETQIK